MNDFKQFFAITKALGMDDETRKALVEQFSEGLTDSLKEMGAKYPSAYSNMMINLRSQQSKEKATKSDIAQWRSRCFAAIGAWLDRTGCTPEKRIEYIKSVACRAAGKEDKAFSDLSIPQLIAVYNSFCRQNETAERAAQLKGVINPSKN